MKIDQPAQILSETGDGFVTREHPVDRDMELTLEFTIREFEGDIIRCRGESLRVGQQLSLEIGGTTIESEVRAIET